jgi:hypothetical protein
VNQLEAYDAQIRFIHSHGLGKVVVNRRFSRTLEQYFMDARGKMRDMMPDTARGREYLKRVAAGNYVLLPGDALSQCP